LREKIWIAFGILFFFWAVYNLVFNGCLVTFISHNDCVAISAVKESGWLLLPVAILGALMGYWKTH